MENIALLQNWYLSQCNEDWELSYQIKIETLDNPGWIVRIDLTDTGLNGRPFEPTYYGVHDKAEESGDEWLDCKVEMNQFIGAGGPLKLDEILGVFLAWARGAA